MIQDDRPGTEPADLDEVPESKLDAGIVRDATTPGAPIGPPLDRIQIGANVYAADGVNVAVVEGVARDVLTLRAGQPGRPIDLPPDTVASVSPDGQRVDLRLSSQEIERFSGADQPGYARLLGQSGQIDSELRREHQEGTASPGASSPGGGAVREPTDSDDSAPA
jgi:hypothetical protein